MTDPEELQYTAGQRQAWLSMLNECLRQLGHEDAAVAQVRWVSEREAAVSQLRQLCASHGDNDWDERLHLADVIEKHLARHLLAP